MSEKADTAGKKGGGLGAVMMIAMFMLVLAIVFLPSAVLIAIGMIPTLVAAMTARSGRGTRAVTIGAMNFAGCMPSLLALWAGGETMSRAFGLVTDPRTIIVMYCAAGAGYAIEWGMSGVVTTVMAQRAAARQKEIAKRQADLVTRWGPEVTGELVLDEYGFPRETVKTSDAIRH